MDETEVPVRCRINGTEWSGTVAAGRLALDFVRGTARLPGTKRGCDWAVCGACTVLVDDKPVHSCTMLAADLDGVDLRTVEGLENEVNGVGRLLQEAFVKHVGLQCGYCTPGQLMNATALLERADPPTSEEVKAAMRGNLCRCGSYVGIAEAITEVRDKLNEQQASS
jgi:aerobic-type carbon monoxide dehydrogenase small subunit (CoxS/CutS family)